jgi:hypothetical protein
MGLPNMGDVLTSFERRVKIKTITKSTVDFVDTEVVTPRFQQCVVQVADKEKLNSETIDWSLEYIMVHSKKDIEVGELIEYKGRDFKVVPRAPWSDYGYIEVIAEETKRPLMTQGAK